MGIELKLRRKNPAKHLLLLLLFIFTVTPTIPAQTPAAPTPEFSPEVLEKLNRKISLDLRSAQVIDVIKYLAAASDLNIVASQTLEGRVTLLLKEVSTGDALDIILLSAGLAFRQKHGIMYVMNDAEYMALYGEPYRDQRQIKIVQVKYTDAGKLGEMLGGVKSAIGKIVVDKQSGTIVIMDTSEKIRLMDATIASVDIPSIQRESPTRTVSFDIKYNKAIDLDPKIQSILTPGVGYSKVDEKTNTILVNDVEPALKKIRELVEVFDKKTREVFIEAKMIQVRLNNRYQMGINWESIVNQGAERAKKVPIDITQTFPASNITTQYGRFKIFDLGRTDVEATINMLHTFGDTRTIAAPQLAAENNEAANILVGTREAFVTSTVSQASATTTTSESITFVDVGVKLSVQSLINSDGFISMKITPEISSVGRTLTTSNGNSIPIVDTTQAATKILVKDGHTALIGGLMKNENNKAVNKLPILGDLPVVGAAFRSTDDNITKTELVIFLTPHIIEGDEALPYAPIAGGKPLEGLREVHG